MTTKDIHYRRNLPHYHPDGFPLFITFRLAGSLPVDVWAELKAQREFELRTLKNRTFDERTRVEQKHFDRFDDWLDRCEFGPRWLQVDVILYYAKPCALAH